MHVKNLKYGAFHSTKNSEIFEKGTNGTEISWERFQKIRKLFNSRKANFRKFQNENQMEQKFPENFFRKFGYTSKGCPLFRKLCKFAIFYSAIVLLARSPRSSQKRWRRRVFENGFIFYLPLSYR